MTVNDNIIETSQGSIGEDEQFMALLSAWKNTGPLRLRQEALQQIFKYIDSRASSAPAAPIAPDGWKLVPIKLTQEMIDAIEDAVKAETSVEWDTNLGGNTHFDNAENVYQAMLNASPAPQQEGSEAGNGN